MHASQQTRDESLSGLIWVTLIKWFNSDLFSCTVCLLIISQQLCKAAIICFYFVRFCNKLVCPRLEELFSHRMLTHTHWNAILAVTRMTHWFKHCHANQQVRILAMIKNDCVIHTLTRRTREANLGHDQNDSLIQALGDWISVMTEKIQWFKCIARINKPSDKHIKSLCASPTKLLHVCTEMASICQHFSLQLWSLISTWMTGMNQWISSRHWFVRLNDSFKNKPKKPRIIHEFNIFSRCNLTDSWIKSQIHINVMYKMV